VCVHAGSRRSPGIGYRLVGNGLASDPRVAQGAIGIAQEKAADDRFGMSVSGAPVIEPAGLGEVH
jgi:hypothetical protein